MALQHPTYLFFCALRVALACCTLHAGAGTRRINQWQRSLRALAGTPAALARCQTAHALPSLLRIVASARRMFV